MEYFKINYHRLQNLPQLKYYVLIIIVLIMISILLILACFMCTYQKISFYGIYNDNVLKIKINSKLSDIFKNNQYIEFNNHKTSYKIMRYGEYEIINNEIYQEIDLAIDKDKDFINNEVGFIELYYNKQKIIKYILKLFK